jgi:ATP-dependent RNA helicase DeaD
MINFDEQIRRALSDAGYNSLTQVQERAIPLLLQTKSVIVQAKTGSGKTASYVLPLLQLGYPSLVITPTRELAGQVSDEFKKLGKYKGINVATIIGGVGYTSQLNELRSAKIVVGTPGRLLDLWSKDKLDFSQFQAAVVDEVDRMFDMGFVDDVRMILKHTTPKVFGFFSATVPPEVESLAREFSRCAELIKLDEYKPVEEVEQRFVETRNDWTDKVSKLRELLNSNRGKIIVFTRTKERAKMLYNSLWDLGYRASVMYGDLPQAKREQNLRLFREGKRNVLVSTDLASRGIDVIDVDLVVNFDAPRDIETYIHRVGRTGRMGRNGVAITLYTTREREIVNRMKNLSKKLESKETANS